MNEKDYICYVIRLLSRGIEKELQKQHPDYKSIEAKQNRINELGAILESTLYQSTHEIDCSNESHLSV